MLSLRSSPAAVGVYPAVVMLPGDRIRKLSAVRCAVSAAMFDISAMSQRTSSWVYPGCEVGSAEGEGAGLGRVAMICSAVVRFRPTMMICARLPRRRANASRMPCPMPEVLPTNMAVGV